ncbi:MAG TPA: type I DNA topoisomerase [Candidatus Paceibacterota bacterium]|nr:type I DNA topoisomerase [Candidatus Paceibacterota bacterium]
MTKLVIVESPTKAKTISRFLGSDFIVKSSYGHVRDLPKAELGIDVEHGFEPQYVIPTKARKNVTELKKEAAKADEIILATDEDREGESIAWHLVQALGFGKSGRGKAKEPKPTRRIVFHEITESAITDALRNPRDIDQRLVDAQQARRVLDRLVGYKLSPILWKRFWRGLSAGRVQSVAVRLIVEREREISAFVPEEYWTLAAELRTAGGQPLIATLVSRDGQNLDKFAIRDKKGADRVVTELAGASWNVKGIKRTEMTRMPHAAFTTSTMQQDAARRLRFSSKQTMTIAQQLYEAGFITYMRTDSVNLSEQALAQAEAYITGSLGPKYHERRRFRTKSKSAQEAHEAIRPTEISRTPQELTSQLTPQQAKLYDLIWRRAVASQMTKAVFDSMSIDIGAGTYGFRATGTTLRFDGFLKILPTRFEEHELPPVAEGDALSLTELKPEQHFTKPPPRYSEASLIKTLEKEGIGRPSTYASIISTIVTRKYVEKDRSRQFHPTEAGMLVNDFLVANFPGVVDVTFTSTMEDGLDEIARGEREWVPTVRGFYEPFAKDLVTKTEEAKEAKAAETEQTGIICEKCGNPMVVKRGRFGKFIACSNFPACKNILKEKKEKEEPEKVGRECPKDGGELVYRSSRFGKFIACGNFPKCRYTEKIPKADGDTGPEDKPAETPDSSNQNAPPESTDEA